MIFCPMLSGFLIMTHLQVVDGRKSSGMKANCKHVEGAVTGSRWGVFQLVGCVRGVNNPTP
jgi:hypothetical protein